MRKHIMQEVRVFPRAMVPHVNGEAAQSGEAMRAQNVRQQEDSLQVTGQPVATGAMGAGERLLLLSGDHRVTSSGRVVKVDGSVVATVDGDIVGAHAIGGMLVVVTTGGLTCLTERNGAWQSLDPSGAVPQLRFVADVSTTRADIAAYTFAEPYTLWQAPLADIDAMTLSRALRSSWNALTADAAAEGYHTAPLLMRWAVRMVDDTYLWISEPVRVGDATMANAERISAQVEQGSGGFTGTQATMMALKEYRVHVEVDQDLDASWLPLLKSIDVFATREADLLASSRALDYRCLTHTTSPREYVLEMGLTRRSADAIASQLGASPWQLVARAPATAHVTSGDFVTPVVTQSLTNAQCEAIGSMLREDGFVCSTSAGGHLYCCTPGGDVLVSAAGNALVEAHRTRVAGSTPLRLAAVTRPLYSGGFGRYPVYVFTTDGTYAIAQNVSGTLGTARLVDRVVIDAAVAPVEGGGDVWFVSRHGHLCRLRGATVTVCQRDVAYTSLAWCNAYSELWMLPADGGYPVVRMANGAMSVRTVDADALYSDALHAVCVTDTGALLDLEREQAVSLPVEWHTHPLALDPLMSQAVRRVVWHVKGHADALTLKVTGQRGIMAQDSDVSVITLSGDIDQPLAAAPMMVPARTLRLQMTGLATTGTLLLPCLLYTGPHRPDVITALRTGN